MSLHFTSTRPATDGPTAGVSKVATSNAGNEARRNLHRVPHRVPCRVRLVDRTTGEVRTVVGETLNFSPGGVALQLGIDVPVGTWVETLVPHLHGDPLFLCGTVVHTRRTLHANFEIGVSMNEDVPPPFA